MALHGAVSKSGVVLDAGGGTGKWTIPIVGKGLKVVLYDISREMLNVARRKIMEEHLENMVVFFKEGDVCEINFSENHFNFVLAEGGPISYCSNLGKAVGELARILKHWLLHGCWSRQLVQHCTGHAGSQGAGGGFKFFWREGFSLKPRVSTARFFHHLI